MFNNLSVIIRARNEERWIGHTIQSVIDLLPGSEIIVVNNNSTDESIQIVKHFMRDPNLDNTDLKRYADLRIINISDYSPGKSINLGVRESRKDICMLLSSHCVLNKINFEKHLNDLNTFKSIFAKQIPVWNGKKIFPRYIWSHFINQEVTNMYSEIEKRYFLHNAAVIYQKKFLLDNPFDENLQTKEDRYWAQKVINEGEKILYDPEFEIFHHYTINGNTWKGLA